MISNSRCICSIDLSVHGNAYNPPPSPLHPPPPIWLFHEDVTKICWNFLLCFIICISILCPISCLEKWEDAERNEERSRGRGVGGRREEKEGSLTLSTSSYSPFCYIYLLCVRRVCAYRQMYASACVYMRAKGFHCMSMSLGVCLCVSVSAYVQIHKQNHLYIVHNIDSQHYYQWQTGHIHTHTGHTTITKWFWISFSFVLTQKMKLAFIILHEIARPAQYTKPRTHTNKHKHTQYLYIGVVYWDKVNEAENKQKMCELMWEKEKPTDRCDMRTIMLRHVHHVQYTIQHIHTRHHIMMIGFMRPLFGCYTQRLVDNDEPNVK